MSTNKRIWSLLLLALLGLMTSCSSERIEIRILHTTDVHGNLFPYDYINDRPGTGSMARLSSFVRQARSQTPSLLLLDGGDMLQGEPINYYSNYIDSTDRPNAVVAAMNFLRYDAATIGNHDIEPGAKVYDRFVRDASFPILGANAIRRDNGEPYFTPYVVREVEGAKVVILGLTTPAIPQWLPEHLWSQMRFVDLIESAQTWVPKLLEQERPDLLIALIHSGLVNNNDDYLENAGERLAHEVPGIDLILMGHDHRQTMQWVKRSPTDSVLLLNPANHLDRVGDLRISLERSGGRVVGKQITASFVELEAYEPDQAFVNALAPYEQGVRTFLDQRIGLIDRGVVARDALFGPTPYMDVLHRMQLATVGAEVSFAAPLSLGAELPAGDLYVRDLFKWCPFSNYLYAMELTGAEIKGYLEHSYAGWTAQMTSREDHLLNLRPDAKPEDRYKTAVPTYNYSAAQGIDYTVDVTKPIGQRVSISQMSSGEPFVLDRKYRCAINSYRAGGAGGMLTVGAGIPKEELTRRILMASEHDQLYSLMRFFETKGIVSPTDPANWSFVPVAWAREGEQRDRAFLFGQ